MHGIQYILKFSIILDAVPKGYNENIYLLVLTLLFDKDLCTTPRYCKRNFELESRPITMQHRIQNTTCPLRV